MGCLRTGPEKGVLIGGVERRLMEEVLHLNALAFEDHGRCFDFDGFSFLWVYRLNKFILLVLVLPSKCIFNKWSRYFHHLINILLIKLSLKLLCPQLYHPPHILVSTLLSCRLWSSSQSLQVQIPLSPQHSLPRRGLLGRRCLRFGLSRNREESGCE